MKKLLLIVLVIIAGISAKDSEKTNLNIELKGLMKLRLDAFAQRDTANLSTLCTENYQLITPTGSQLDLKKTKDIIINSPVKVKGITLVTFQSYVKGYESFAFSVAEVKEDVVEDNRLVVNNLLVTEVYIKERGRWKIQLTHTSQKACFFLQK